MILFWYALQFLGAFAKFLRATINFVMSVCSSVRMEQFFFHWTDFHEIWYLSILLKSLEKIQIPSKYDKSNGYFICRPIYIFDHMSHNSS